MSGRTFLHLLMTQQTCVISTTSVLGDCLCVRQLAGMLHAQCFLAKATSAAAFRIHPAVTVPLLAGKPAALPESDLAPQPAELAVEPVVERPHTDSDPPTLEPTVPDTQPVTQAEVPNFGHRCKLV